MSTPTSRPFQPWRIAVNLLAAFGALTLVLASGLLLLGNAVFGGTDEPAVEARLASPGGALEAIHVLSSGGGAAGWCREVVLVRDRSGGDIPPAPQASDDRVFSTGCGTRFTMHWATPQQLVIRYPAPAGQLGGFELRPADKAGRFRVRLEPEM